MPTHCSVGILEGNNGIGMTITYIHWDGHPSTMYPLLEEYYSSERKLRSLLKLGEISTLGVHLKGDLTHWDMQNSKGFLKYTMAYYRDLGYEFLKSQTFKNFDSAVDYLRNHDVDFLYLYSPVESRWLVYKINRYSNPFYEVYKI